MHPLTSPVTTAAVDLRTKAALLSLRVAVEGLAVDALMRLGLEVDRRSLEQAITEERTHAPRLVVSVRLRGYYSRNMYDEHPGWVYFMSEGSQTIDLPFAMGLMSAMPHALQLLEQTRRTNRCDDADVEFDGQFHPAEAELLDQWGATIQLYSRRRNLIACRDEESWLRDDELPTDFAHVQAVAQALEHEAAEEARWDNFSSAERLRHQARFLRNLVSVAQLRQLVIP